MDVWGVGGVRVFISVSDLHGLERGVFLFE